MQVRDEVVKDRGDVQRRLDVLTEFFNKKEAELQKQLGLQSAKWDNTMRGWCDLNFHTFPGLATCPLMLRALQGSWFLWPRSWTALGLRFCKKLKVISKAISHLTILYPTCSVWQWWKCSNSNLISRWNYYGLSLTIKKKASKLLWLPRFKTICYVETNYNLLIGTGEKSPRELGCSSTSWTKTHRGAWYSPAMV